MRVGGIGVWMGVGCPCPPVLNDIVTPRHLFQSLLIKSNNTPDLASNDCSKGVSHSVQSQESVTLFFDLFGKKNPKVQKDFPQILGLTGTKLYQRVL